MKCCWSVILISQYTVTVHVVVNLLNAHRYCSNADNYCGNHKHCVSLQRQQCDMECRSQKKSSCMGSLWNMRPRSCMALFLSSSLCCRSSCSSRCRSNISSIDTRVRGNFSSFSVSLHRYAQHYHY